MNKKTSKNPSSKKLKSSTVNYGLNSAEELDYKRKQKVTHNKGGNQVILLDPNSSFSPVEKVFSIDHIMELIFLELGVQTLKNCRLVSRRWGHLGAKALQNVVNISLIRSLSSDPRFLFSSVIGGDDSIQVLFDVMNNSPEFPCNSFTFFNACYNKMKIATPLEPFLNTQARHIKKIQLEGLFFAEDLIQLIFTLALNVKQLVLGNVFFYYESKRNVEPEKASSTQDTHGSRSRKAKTPLEGPAFKNLRVFKSFNSIPNTIIYKILESSPNLAEVSLHHQDLHCLVKPRNLLHLVKKIRICITDPNIDSLEVVANNHENNFAVQEFEFGGLGGDFDEPEPPRRLLDFLVKILQGCSASCTKMVLLNTLQDFQIPLMPQVKHLRFAYHEHYFTRRPLTLLPQGVSLQDTFPCLESLRIDRYGYYEDEPHPPIENIFGSRDHSPVPNVKKLTLLIHNTDESVLQSFQKMFPNAAIHTDEN